MSQRYTSEVARHRMERDLCPECGDTPGRHINTTDWWAAGPQWIKCDLLAAGVRDRIEQYREDFR